MGGRRWSLLTAALVVIAAEVLIFAAFGAYLRAGGDLPPWVGGGISALLVGVTLRVLEPALRRIGERVARRRHTLPPPPPS